MKTIFDITSREGQPVQPVLSMQIGEKNLAFAITGAKGQDLYRLCYFQREPEESGLPERIREDYPELKENFYSIQLVFDYPNQALVPATEFRKEDAGLLLKALYGETGTDSVITENLPEWQLYNIYAVPSGVLQQLNKWFPAAVSRHRFSLELRGLQVAEEAGVIRVDIRQDDFTLVAGKAGRLLLARTFPYETPADVIYYLLSVCSQLELGQQETVVELSGLLEKDSALFKELNQYFIHIRMREADWTNSGQPAHFFTTLNELARCAS